MADQYGHPFGGYVASTAALTQTIKDALRVEVNKLSAIFPDPFNAYGAGARVTGSHPDFDAIEPEMANKVQSELKQFMETSIESAAET